MQSSGATMVSFSDDGSRVINESLDTSSFAEDQYQSKLIDECDPIAFSNFYEIQWTADSILHHGALSVALQFPDALLPDAPRVIELLKPKLKDDTLLFILGDTSYGSCCVDEVAAQHLSADIIVHYGHACSSPTSSLPVLYVFGQWPLNTNDCVSELAAQLQLYDENQFRSLVVYDPRFHYKIQTVIDLLKQQVQMKFDVESLSKTFVPKDDSNTDGGIGEKKSLNENVVLVYIGAAATQQWINVRLEYPNAESVTYDPVSRYCGKEKFSVTRMLMRRYYLVQQAKEADVIGIVVGTLAVSQYREMISKIENLIAAAGRKSYLFVVGKINVPKLANYSEIDLFVIIACPENSMIDSKEFYKPIVTPFELSLALDSTLEWTGDNYKLDFRDVLPSIENSAIRVESKDDDDDAPEFSLISGTFKTRPSSSSTSTSIAEKENTMAIQEKKSGALALAYEESPAAYHLSTKSYQGLEARIGDDKPYAAVIGQRGIAASYENIVK